MSQAAVTSPKRGAVRPDRPAGGFRDRVRLAAALLAALVTAAVLWQLLDRGGSERSRPAPATRSFADARLGLQFGYPPTWRLARRGPAPRLVSPDGSISIVFASPSKGAFVRQARRDTERALLNGYRPARIVGRVPGRLGTRRVTTTELIGTTRNGRRIRMLAIPAASTWRT